MTERRSPEWALEWHPGGEGSIVRWRLPRSAVGGVFGALVLGALLALGACLAGGGQRFAIHGELVAARALQRALTDRAAALGQDLAQLERRAASPGLDPVAPAAAPADRRPSRGPGR